MPNKLSIGTLEPLEIIFNDEIINCLLSNEAIILLTEEYGDVNKLLDKESDKPYDLAAKLLYSGVKLGDADFTYEKARRIVMSGGQRLIGMILDNLTDSFVVDFVDESTVSGLGEIIRILRR